MTVLWLFWQILIQYCKFLMPRPFKQGILGASTTILSNVIDKYAFMCGSNFYESDVTPKLHALRKNDLYRKWIWRLCQTRYLQSQSKILVSFFSRKCSKWTEGCFQCLQLKPNTMSLSKRLSELSNKKLIINLGQKWYLIWKPCM